MIDGPMLHDYTEYSNAQHPNGTDYPQQLQVHVVFGPGMDAFCPNPGVGEVH